MTMPHPNLGVTWREGLKQREMHRGKENEKMGKIEENGKTKELGVMWRDLD